MSNSTAKYKRHQKFMKILGASYEIGLFVSRLTLINPEFLENRLKQKRCDVSGDDF